MFNQGDYVHLKPGRHHSTARQGSIYTVEEYCDVTATCVLSELYGDSPVIPNVPQEYLELQQDPAFIINEHVEWQDVFRDDAPQVDPKMSLAFCEALDALEKEKEYAKDSALSPGSAFKHGLGRGYKDLAIQPMRLSHENKLNACQHTAIKYIMGYNLSGGKGRQDLEKAKHTIDLLLELENL